MFKGEEYSISFAGKDLTDPDVLGDKTFDATVSLESPNQTVIEAAAEKAAKVLATEKAENTQQTVTEPEENKSSPLPIIIIIAVVVIAAAVMLLKKKNKED